MAARLASPRELEEIMHKEQGQQHFHLHLCSHFRFHLHNNHKEDHMEHRHSCSSNRFLSGNSNNQVGAEAKERGK